MTRNSDLLKLFSQAVIKLSPAGFHVLL